MRVLLVSATFLECRNTFAWLDQAAVTGVDRLVTGVGILAATWQIERRCRQTTPDLVLQAGIAGSSQASDTGGVFAVTSEELADLGAEETDGFHSLFSMQLADPEAFPFAGGKLPNPYDRLIADSGLLRRDGRTINTLRTASEAERKWQQNAVPFVESMEGAALHYVALQQQIPFLQVRAVSNLAGDRDKSHWKITESLEMLHRTLQPLIQNLLTKDAFYFRL